MKLKSDYNKNLTTSTLIELSGFHFFAKLF